MSKTSLFGVARKRTGGLTGLCTVASDLSKLPFPVDIKSSEDTPPTMTTTQISMNLCDLLPHEAVPDDEQCPKGARVCLKVINEKKGQPDRVTQVISTAAAEGDDADAFKWSTDLGRSLEGSESE